MVGTAHSTQFLAVDGGRIAYDDTRGDGPLVVCLPGMGDNRATYRFLAPVLAERGYRVVTADLRGAGESDAAFADYSTTAVAADLRALVRHLDAGPAVVVANSYSAGAAVIAAADESSAFAGLVLTGPFVRSPKQLGAAARLAIAVVGRFPRAWTAFWGTLFASAKPDDFAAARARLLGQLREPGRMAALRAMSAGGHDASERRLAELAAGPPVRIVMGSKDPDFKPDPRAEADWIAERSGGDVVMIDGSGHYPAAEDPRATADAVLPFLAGVAGAAQ
ncbi:alpha/beta fold hydrolase [Streptantibioticus ferralitis]|uniref:Alpha/beta hydrolase n=1 Tax=Streptantibioticus ferralitis TaxID=236510 RepID=A0ABT5ZBF3_9ACTN|nr:alpha/beta hydrolase [Streptantibioticus ferralitis]MDF2261114.1 alpha/beta hydrolase [Streptantibioticus ferralitis]